MTIAFSAYRSRMMSSNSWFRLIWQRWLNKRIPPNKVVQLSQRQIFILPTKYGWVSLFVLLILFVGGVNYANSLVLGSTYWLAAIFLVSIFHTHRNLAGLTISIFRVENGCAGEYANFHINLAQQKKDNQHQALLLNWGSCQQIASLTNQSQMTVCMALPMKRRGRFQPGRLKVESVYPLGLFRAWSWIDLDVACWVYPKPIASYLPLVQGSVEIANANFLNRTTGVDDFEGLQTYTPGDPLKHVHWKVFARTNDLFIKTFIAAHQPQCCLDWSQMPNQDLEMKLSHLCYWVLQLSSQKVSFTLVLPSKKIEAGSGDLHCHKCLLELAKV